MDCIVAAGGHLTDANPLFPYTGGKPKAFIDIGGRTMLERVVAALAGSRHVQHILVVGVGEEEATGLKLAGSVSFLPEQGSILLNVKSGIDHLCEGRPDTAQLLFSTADIPLLRSDVVDAFVEACHPFDRLIYYNMVTRQTMEAYCPDSRRTFAKLKDVEVAGGDLVLAHRRVVQTDPALWQALVGARKQPWRLAHIVGLSTLFKLLTRRLSLQEIEELACRSFGAPVKVLLSPHPELAMDVDKPHHIELIRRYVAGHSY